MVFSPPVTRSGGRFAGRVQDELAGNERRGRRCAQHGTQVGRALRFKTRTQPVLSMPSRPRTATRKQFGFRSEPDSLNSGLLDFTLSNLIKTRSQIQTQFLRLNFDPFGN